MNVDRSKEEIVSTNQKSFDDKDSRIQFKRNINYSSQKKRIVNFKKMNATQNNDHEML